MQPLSRLFFQLSPELWTLDISRQRWIDQPDGDDNCGYDRADRTREDD